MIKRRHFLASTAGLAAFSAIRTEARPRVYLRNGEAGIYAKAGEKTYCANGCLLGRFGRTVYVGAMPKAGDLIPEPGMSIGAIACPYCTAPVTEDWGKYFMTAEKVNG